MKKPFPLSEVYTLLEPGPVVLVSTGWRGRANVMPMSWHTMMEFEPPLVGCVIGADHLTFELLTRSRECVLNIPTVDLLAKTVRAGNCSGRAVDKFSTFGLTPLPAAEVGAPLVAECPANLECRIADRRLVNRYGFFVLEVVRAWRDARPKRLETFHHLGHGRFMIAGRTRTLPSRMP